MKLTDAFRSSEKAPKKIHSPNALLIYMNEAHDDKGHSTLHQADKSRWVQTVRYQLHFPTQLLSSTSTDLSASRNGSDQVTQKLDYDARQ